MSLTFECGDKIKYVCHPENPNHLYRREIELGETGTVDDISYLGYWIVWDKPHRPLWVEHRFLKKFAD